jgi:hypothetical protein
MTLSKFVASKKLSLFDDLKAGREPGEGVFAPEILAECRKKGSPQVGMVRFEPNWILFEFIYPDPLTSAGILTVTLPARERIVFLPVPEWVVENIWQGDIDGSYHFETEAEELLQKLASEITEEGNVKWFGPRQAKRRE